MVLTVRFYTKKYDFLIKKNTKSRSVPVFQKQGQTSILFLYHLRSVPILPRKTSKIHI